MVPGLAIVRQLEAVGFRAWPAASVYYDGTWAIRMTAAYPSRRLNSINPLDPGDTRDIPKRVELAVRRFRAHGRVPCFRVSPLAPPALEAYLEGLGWKRKHETIVMTADLAAMDLLKAVDRASLEDIGHFVDASLSIHERPEELRSGFSQLLKSIHSNRGMFVLEEGGRAVSNVLCVQDGAKGMAAILSPRRLNGRPSLAPGWRGCKSRRIMWPDLPFMKGSAFRRPMVTLIGRIA